MVKSCMKKRGKRTLKVRFNKVVKDNEGSQKKIKRVNLTRLAYSVLKTPLLDINRDYMLKLLNKHKQTGSHRRAKQEVIQALDKLEDRILTPKGEIVTIGSEYVLQHDLDKTIDWTTKLSTAAEVLKSVE